MRNGSGTYSAPSGSFNPATNGNSATAADWDTLLADLVAAMTQSVSADGQTPITGNFNMGNNKLTSLGAGSASGQSLAWQQLFSQGTESDLPSAATTDIGAQNTNFLRITGTNAITSFGTNYNGPRFLRFAGALTLTHNATTLILPGGANIITAAGDTAIVTPISGGWKVVAYQRAALLELPFLQDYMQSGAVTYSGTTLTIQATQAANSDNSVVMTISSAWTKTGVAAAAGWSAGSGGGMLDSGTSLAANTTYYLYQIFRPDTAVSDYVVSTGDTAPTLTGSLAPYTKYRKLPVLVRVGNSGTFVYSYNYPMVRGGFEVLEKRSLAGVATSDFFLPPGFRFYDIRIGKLRPTNNGTFLWWRLMNNATPYAGASDYISMSGMNANGTITNPVPSVVSYGELSHPLSNSSDHDEQIAARFQDIYDTTKRLGVDSDSSGPNATPAYTYARRVATYVGTTSGVGAARNGIRLLSSDGANFLTGEVTILGVPS